MSEAESVDIESQLTERVASRRFIWQSCVVAIAVVAAAAALRLWPLQALGVRLAWLTFYPAATVAALYGGFSAGVLGTALSCLAVLLVLPAFVRQPFIKDSADWLGLIVFFGTCTMISAIAGAMRRARARERQAETERDRFFTLSLDMLCIAKPDGYFKHVNPAFTKALGWSVGELLARPVLDFVHPDDHAAMLRHMEKQLLADERPLGFVTRFRHTNGSWRWLSWKSAPAPAGFLYATVRDITELQIEAEARRLLVAIIESSDDAIISKTLDGIVTSWNAGAERIFGYTAAEMIGSPITRIVPPARLAEEAQILERLRRGERVSNMETARVTRDGRAVHVSATVSPIRDGAGQIVGASTIVRDITARKQGQESLAAALRELEDVKLAFDHHSIVAITDARGTITFVNDKFCAISQYSREELLGQDHRIINSSFHPKAFIRDLWTTIGRGRVWKGEIKNRAKDGSFYWVDTTIVPFLHPDGTPYQYVAIRTDITVRKQAEEEIRALNTQVQTRATQLEAANRELEAFSYSVSHDLRAPVRHIEGYVGLLSKRAGDTLDETSRRYMKTVTDTTKEMGQLIDDLLAFSRMGRTELQQQEVDLNRLVEDTLAGLESQTKGRQIVWTTPPLPRVQADPAMLKQVFVNLLSNAVKYSRRRDTAEIELGVASETDNEVVVFVRDNGAGFDMRYSDKLFGVFQRLHRADEFEGTGIGLANVRRIITRHGGRIWAEAEVDKGATFYFSLTKAAPQQESATRQ